MPVLSACADAAFQGPRGLRGLQGPMGSVGDRVRHLYPDLPFLTLFFGAAVIVSYCGCLQGLPGFRGKPGAAGVIGKTVSHALSVTCSRKAFIVAADWTTGTISK